MPDKKKKPFVIPKGKTINWDNIKTTRNRPYNKDNIQYIYSKLSESHLNDDEVAAIITNVIEESGGDPLSYNVKGKSYGLLHWTDDRYKKPTKPSVQDELDNQIKYIIDSSFNIEDKKSWTDGGKGSGYKTAAEAHTDFLTSEDAKGKLKAYTLGYVRPKGKQESVDNRLEVLNQVQDKMNNVEIKRNGGMIYNAATLQPRKRKYVGGGQVAFRDRFGDVQGNSYGAEKGIQGETIKNTSMMAGSVGGLAGAGVAAFAPALSTGIATAIGGAAAGAAAGSVVPILGTAVGALIGGLVGIFTGRKKKRKAKAAAEEADRQRQVIAGNNQILNDEMELSNTAQHEGSLDFYGDSNLGDVTATQELQPTTTQQGASMFGGYQRYARCGGRVKRRKYADGGQIQETSSNTAEVVGPSHEQGGVQYNSQAEVEGGEAIMTDADNAFVFSDTLKYKGQTFADIAKPLMEHKGYLEKSVPIKSMMLGRALSLTDRSTYAIDRNTNSRNSEKANLDLKNTTGQINQIQAMLTQLYNMQEQMKAESGMDAEPKETFENGGQIENSNTGFINLSNDRTFIEPQQQPPITVQGMRCGGKTRKMALGGFLSSPYAGLAIEGGMNLIGGLGNYFGNKADLKRMESMPVPQKAMQKAVNLEWDINTDSEINDVNSMVKSMERYITGNVSNSQVGRQSILLARTQGSRLRGRIKQQEHNQELQTRNQGRMINAEITARNLQTSEDNAAAVYNHKMEAITRESQNSAALASLISSVGRTVGTGLQTKMDIENMQAANLIQVAGNDKSRDWIFDNMSPTMLKRMFGTTTFKGRKSATVSTPSSKPTNYKGR